METPHIAEAPAERRASGKVTAAIGLAVAVVGVVFAFNATDAATHWFALFKLIHVGVAVFWVGGGLAITTLALRAERSGDAGELATIARQAAFIGERFFAPGGLVVLAMGIVMVVNRHLGWGTFWIDAGLVGYASTFVTGIAFLSPQSKRISALLEEKGAAAAETQAAIRRILLVARVDVGVLLLVVADMLLKPFS
ncbi:MAG TPA: DUF2269 family protein [Gaiellaceae bacterium]|nr:DUF2269 family protein [Gaiellaceae bacterium]